VIVGEGASLEEGVIGIEFGFARFLTAMFGTVDAAYRIVWNAVLCIIPFKNK
jgi:hypothetical protein